jgi:hypothetical protein
MLTGKNCVVDVEKHPQGLLLDLDLTIDESS